MAWIIRRGNQLKYSGRLKRPRSFDAWAAADGQTAVDAITATRWFAWFGRQRAAKNEIWRDFQQLAESSAFGDHIQTAVDEYAAHMGGFGLERPSLPRATIDLRRLLTIPRALYNGWVFETLMSRLRRLPAAVGLKGGIELISYFGFELVNAIDGALAASPPSLRRPVHGDGEWSIVGLNAEFVWSVPFHEGPDWRGHYFVYETPRDGFTRARRKELTTAMEALDAGLADLTRVRKSAILAERPVSAR